MFQIAELQQIIPGKYRVVLTIDDPGILPVLRFLRRVNDVAERLDRRIDLERRILRRKEAAEAHEPDARANRARILALYRELPGARKDRLKALRRILTDQDSEGRWTYDGVIFTIARAVREERTFRKARAQELARDGHSCREIGQILGISPAQAVRLKNFAPKCPRIDDPPSSMGNPPGYVPAFNPEEKNQRKTAMEVWT